MKKTFKTLVFAMVGLLALASCEDVPAPYTLPDKNGGSSTPETTIEPQGDGTAASPFNVAAAVAMIKGMEAGVESTEEYYIKGKVLAVTTTEATIAQYGNHTFTMVDEGDNSTVFTAFQVYGPGKQKFTSVNDIKVGDEVVVCGKVVNYKGNTPETVGKGAAYVVSINSAGGGDSQGGGSETSTSSKEKPLTITQAKAASGNNYVKGYIVGYVDGQKIAEGAVFGVPSAAETEILLAETPDETNPDNVFPVQLPAGDVRNAIELFAHPDYLKKEVLLYGSLEKYFGVPGMKSTSWGCIDGKTFGTDPEGGGSGTEPSGEAKGSGTEADPYNAIAAIQYTKSLAANVESENNIYVTGIISSIKYTYSSNYGTATYNISDNGKAENEFTVYGSYYLNNQPWKDGDTQIQVGDEVVVCGKVVNYQGNTPEFSNKKNWLVSIKTNGGGQGGDDGGQGGETVTDLENGDFESWGSDSEPTGWKSTSSASNAELGKSTEAHGGSFACIVKAPGTANKRLATQEITLAAGSYTFSYYAKSTTAEKSQTKGGYVHVNDDNTITDSYQYSKTFTDLSNTEWTLVSYDFELTEETKLCLVVMNPKNSSYSVSQDILVDDATLVKK